MEQRGQKPLNSFDSDPRLQSVFLGFSRVLRGQTSKIPLTVSKNVSKRPTLEPPGHTRKSLRHTR